MFAVVVDFNSVTNKQQKQFEPSTRTLSSRLQCTQLFLFSQIQIIAGLKIVFVTGFNFSVKVKDISSKLSLFVTRP